jgi:hypothetical protein
MVDKRCIGAFVSLARVQRYAPALLIIWAAIPGSAWAQEPAPTASSPSPAAQDSAPTGGDKDGHPFEPVLARSDRANLDMGRLAEKLNQAVENLSRSGGGAPFCLMPSCV